MHRLFKSSLRNLAASTVLFGSCTLATGAQVGVWNFNDNLNNSIGGKLPLTVEGGWTPSYIDETINGSPARVLSFPKFDTTQSINMTNEGAANGFPGAVATNNWSIAMDVKFPFTGNPTGIYETDAVGLGDADYFINNEDQIGTNDNYGGLYVDDTWTRMVITVDSATTPGSYVVKGYLDGVLASTAPDGYSPGGGQGVKDFLHLFTDDDLETSFGYVNSIAYYGETLNDGAVATLGTATAAGIASTPNQVGLWQLNNNLNNSISGKAPLAVFGPWTPTYETQSINGSDATVLSFSQFDNTSSLDMPNQAAKQEPGPPRNTNAWSIIMDVKFPAFEGRFTSLFNTDSLESNDGEYFLRDDGTIGISGDYKGFISADTWTRIAVTVDGSVDGEYVISGYVDGVSIGEAVTSGDVIDGRFAVDEFLRIFSDTDDNETSAGLVNSIAYYDEVLSPEALLALGAAAANGIPVTAPIIDADFDNNGRVDGADFLAWQRGLGKAAGALNADGDANGDGKVDAADFTVWKGAFGNPAGVAAVGAVPEPASVALATIALGAAAAFRKRRS